MQRTLTCDITHSFCFMIHTYVVVKMLLVKYDSTPRDSLHYLHPYKCYHLSKQLTTNFI